MPLVPEIAYEFHEHLAVPMAPVPVQCPGGTVLRWDAIPLQYSAQPLPNVKAKGRPVYAVGCRAVGSLQEDIQFISGVFNVKGGGQQVAADTTLVTINGVPGNVETPKTASEVQEFRDSLMDNGAKYGVVNVPFQCTNLDPEGRGLEIARRNHLELLREIELEAKGLAGKFQRAEHARRDYWFWQAKASQLRGEMRTSWERLVELADKQIASEKHLSGIEYTKQIMQSTDSIRNYRVWENQRRDALLTAWTKGIWGGMAAQSAYWDNQNSKGIRIAAETGERLAGIAEGLVGASHSSPEPLAASAGTRVLTPNTYMYTTKEFSAQSGNQPYRVIVEMEHDVGPTVTEVIPPKK